MTPIQKASEFISAVRSINFSKASMVNVAGDDEPQYAQRKEWIEWILKFADELEKDIKELQALESVNEHAAPDKPYPVAYAVFAENGNLRIWCTDPVQAQTLREIHGRDLVALVPLQDPGTPAAWWRVKGEADPFETRYDCERAKLFMGQYTDDEIANKAYMQLSGPIAEGVKDRIRWLSRQLVEAENANKSLQGVTWGVDWGRNSDQTCASIIKTDADGHIEVVAREYGPSTLQSRVLPWLLECFGAEIANDRAERNHRFLEEALELVQSTGCTADEAHKLVDYVYSRPTGEPSQEVGGVMITLAALCLANNLDMHSAGEKELARISQSEMVVKIREKQKRKPAMSPLPGAYPERQPTAVQDGWMPILGTCLGIPTKLLNEQQAKTNHNQSLAKLRERGGISLDEALAIAEKRKWRSIDGQKSLLTLTAMLAAAQQGGE